MLPHFRLAQLLTLDFLWVSILSNVYHLFLSSVTSIPITLLNYRPSKSILFSPRVASNFIWCFPHAISYPFILFVYDFNFDFNHLWSKKLLSYQWLTDLHLTSSCNCLFLPTSKTRSNMHSQKWGVLGRNFHKTRRLRWPQPTKIKKKNQLRYSFCEWFNLISSELYRHCW